MDLIKNSIIQLSVATSDPIFLSKSLNFIFHPIVQINLISEIVSRILGKFTLASNYPLTTRACTFTFVSSGYALTLGLSLQMATLAAAPFILSTLFFYRCHAPKTTNPLNRANSSPLSTQPSTPRNLHQTPPATPLFSLRHLPVRANLYQTPPATPFSPVRPLPVPPNSHQNPRQNPAVQPVFDPNRSLMGNLFNNLTTGVNYRSLRPIFQAVRAQQPLPSPPPQNNRKSAQEFINHCALLNPFQSVADSIIQTNLSILTEMDQNLITPSNTPSKYQSAISNRINTKKNLDILIEHINNILNIDEYNITDKQLRSVLIRTSHLIIAKLGTTKETFEFISGNYNKPNIIDELKNTPFVKYMNEFANIIATLNNGTFSDKTSYDSIAGQLNALAEKIRNIQGVAPQYLIMLFLIENWEQNNTNMNTTFDSTMNTTLNNSMNGSILGNLTPFGASTPIRDPNDKRPGQKLNFNDSTMDNS